jgi:hypothetical protein
MNVAGISTLQAPGRTASAEPFMSQHTPGLQHRVRFPLWVLQKLPPSVPPIDPMNRVVVAFAVNGRWAVRSYPRSGSNEIGDLMQT